MVLQSDLKTDLLTTLRDASYSYELGEITTVTVNSGALDTVAYSGTTGVSTDSDTTSTTVVIDIPTGVADGENIGAINLKGNNNSWNIAKHTSITKTTNIFMRYSVKTKLELVN